MRRTSSFLSPDILLDLWETRAGRALRVLGLDSVRTNVLLLAVLATLIPALATSYVSYQQNRRAIQAKVNEQLTGISSQASREVGLWLKERIYDLRVFAASYQVTENLERGAGSSRRLPDYLNSVKGRFADYEELMVVTPDQRTVASSERQAGRLHLTGDWLQRARVGDPVLGDPARADSTAIATMEIAVPITSVNGRFLGVLGARLNFRGIEAVLDSLVKGRDARIAIVERGGRVVAGVGASLTTVPPGTLVRLQEAEGISVRYTAADHVPVIGALSAVSSTDWSAVAELPAASAFAEIRSMRNTSALLVVVLLLVVGSLAWGLGLLIVRPVARLASAANRVASGDLAVSVQASGRGELSQLTTVFNDMVVRLREGREELERLSVTDPLTGLANRRRLEGELEREVRRADRHGHPFSVLMLDVDRFKTFNDSYGHPAGDAVLKRLANILKECVRDVDTVARYGGEEFTVILPEAPAGEAGRVAERIRARVEGDKFSPAEGVADVGVTVSIGYAVFPEHAKTAGAILETADEALYLSKETGRNRVTGAGKPVGRKKAAD